MKHLSGGIRLSATDLANHLACRHLTELDRAAAERRIEAPHWKDPLLEVLQERGFEHERQYLEHLEAGGRSVLRVEADDPASAFEHTRAAMREGRDVIVQASLTSGRWHGRADVLLKVGAPSALGPWSYEVVDTKLARETRGGTMLQLCVYSDIVGEIQGALPSLMHVVTPGNGFAPQSWRVRELLAYYRWVRARLEAAIDGAAIDGATYPDPVEHCDICRWWKHCDERRRADDHLSLVAGIARLHRRELESWGVGTLAGVARMPLPLERAPRRGSKEGFVRVREQARVQLQGREENRPVHELLDLAEGAGLARLPEPDAQDVFLDLEGDPFVEEGGLEFLFGLAYLEEGEWRYRATWATGRAAEKRAFEEAVDFLMARWAASEGFHLYHYGDYEKSALRRLMGRHATREAEVDRLLRGERFVDLHTIVKQAIRASVERYSIKDLERFYGYVREMALDRSGPVLRAVQVELERGRGEALDAEARAIVEAYNRDDCVSAARLREWLESLRAQCLAEGKAIARPAPKEDQPGEKLDEKVERRRALAARLLEGVPAARADRDAEAHAKYLLAHLLEFHRREEKAPWWEYFRLIECTDEELVEEEMAIGGLSFVERVGAVKKSIVDRYAFPPQETRIRAGRKVQARDAKDIDVAAIDLARFTIDLKKGLARADLHPTGVFEHRVVGAEVIAGALERLAEWVAEHGIDAPGDHRAARDLLLNREPRLSAGATWRLIGEETSETARRLALALDHGVLPIQGPPGSGKTWTGSRLILDLVRAGKRVGVTANSHKVITHLLECVAEARAPHEDFGIVQKPHEDTEALPASIARIDSNERMLAAILSGEARVAGGTSWMWSREDFAGAVDVLVVDEAGQLSLANVLGIAQAADSLILLGDPRQLEQPVQGSHPDGVAISALEHALDGHDTMPEHRGLFLEHTRRLHPRIGAFTSEVFYEGRLEALPGLERQAIAGPTPLAGAGLWYLPVDHEGNQNESPEEIDAIEALLAQLVAPGVEWIDGKGERAALGLDQVLVVAPYNAQVWALRERLPREARVGTVDKFQGQEAPVVLVSMTTSTPEDAPRGMDFLYSLHRLNVATSRARCACVLVASPRIFEPECRTPQQMRLANAFCRYREMARMLELEPSPALRE